MYNKPNGSPEPFDLFTGGKLPELAIAFNLAYDNIEKYIRTIQSFEEPLNNIDKLKDEVFVYLRHYIWKGNTENKNSSGYELDPKEKAIIKKLLTKLKQLRNFHSHVWHDNSMMHFDNELVHFIQDKHEVACDKLLEEKNADATLYLKQLKEYPLFKDGKYITQDGRIFFLSLFLNKGEMQSLLQGLKGSKRTNMPAYQFKHKVYTFYCHREGSSWDNTGVDNKALQQRGDEEQKRILYGRQANRIFSYLKDIPAFTKEEALPLVLSSGKWVHDMDSLLLFIREKNILPGFIFFKMEKEPDDDITGEKELNEEKKALETKEREGYRYFMMPENDKYDFEISYPALKHIATDIFLDANDAEEVENSSLQHFNGVLKDCIYMRNHIYNKLKAEGGKPIHPENFVLRKEYNSVYINYHEHEGSIQERYYTGNEWRHIPISPTPKIEKLLIEWHVAFTQGKNDKPNKGEVTKRVKLLNKIRPKNEPFDTSIYEGLLKTGKKKIIPNTETEPLLFHLGYYYREQDTKKRKEDNFLEWGVRYLMDMRLVPDWYFELEQLKYEQKSGEPESPYKLKKVTSWDKNIPDNFRLRITDNQVNIGIALEGKTYRLRIGEKIMKYLLCWHFRENKKENKSINGFLLNITKDLASIHNSQSKVNLASLQLLEGFAVPELLYKTKVVEENEKGKKADLYKEEVLKFFTEKWEWADKNIKNIKQLNRSEKNAVLLDAYRLFDFNETEGQKFLRKNEYEQMSICHYMLNQEKWKVKGLIERTFKLKRRLPQEIIDILYSVIDTERQNLDDLLILVLHNRKKFLKNKIDLLKLPGIKNRQIKNDIAGFMDIYLNDANLTTEELGIRNKARNKTLVNLPFAVHPALTLKYFYPQQFAAQGFRKEGGAYTNLFYKLRQDARLSTMLPDEILREKPVTKIFEDYIKQFPQDVLLESFTKKWTGTVNDIKTKDILLLLVAEVYLEKYDAHTATEFKKIKNLKKLQLDELFKAEVPVTLKLDQQLKKELEKEYKKAVPEINLLLRMHQLDDYFFRSQKETLAKLAIFYINWRNEELKLYAGKTDIMDKIKAWPDGSAAKPLTMGQLVEARRVNAGYAAELVGYIFDYEKGLLNGHVNKPNSAQKQKMLTDYCLTNGLLAYIDFNIILDWDKITDTEIKKQIKGLRINCLHSLIPLNGSYRQQTMPGTPVAEALHVHTRLGNDRTAPNIYEQDDKNETEEA